MSARYRAGAILHYQNFEFQDGTKKNKYLLILGTYQDGSCLYSLATSQKKQKNNKIGCCQHPSTYFFIAGDGNNFFKKDTWILLNNSIHMNNVEYLQEMWGGAITFKANLNQEMTLAIYQCLDASKDISPKQLQGLKIN